MKLEFCTYEKCIQKHCYLGFAIEHPENKDDKEKRKKKSSEILKCLAN